MTGWAGWRCGALLAMAALAGCGPRASNAVPPRVDTALVIPAGSSTIAIPVTAQVVDLERLLNARVPVNFSSTAAQRAACTKPGVVRRIGCQFAGNVHRGTISVTGTAPDVLRLTMDLDGALDARALSGMTGNRAVGAVATVEATVRLGVTGDWEPIADVSLGYRWVQAPGIEMFDRRISVASVADPLVARLIAELEAAVPECLERLQPRARLEAVWQQGFSVVPVTAEAPRAWLRLTPRALHFANYTIADNVLTLAIGATATTETFVGNRPAAGTPTPLPPPAPVPPGGLGRFRLHVPVIADYSGLETLLEAALKTVESPPQQIRGIGTITASFGDVTIYETTGGRLAIGLAITAGTERQWLRPRGTVWLTALPRLAAGTQQLEIADVAIAGVPDSTSFRMLLALARSRRVQDEIGRALSRDFSAEHDRALAAARAALTQRRVGDFKLMLTLDDVTNGSLKVTGKGLYLPVDAAGSAAVTLQPVVG